MYIDKNTFIFTNEGLKQAKDLKCGDKVYAPNGVFVPVLRIDELPSRIMSKYVTSLGEVIWASKLPTCYLDLEPMYRTYNLKCTLDELYKKIIDIPLEINAKMLQSKGKYKREIVNALFDSPICELKECKYVLYTDYEPLKISLMTFFRLYNAKWGLLGKTFKRHPNLYALSIYPNEYVYTHDVDRRLFRCQSRMPKFIVTQYDEVKIDDALYIYVDGYNYCVGASLIPYRKETPTV